jgi:hypothetical protein
VLVRDTGAPYFETDAAFSLMGARVSEDNAPLCEADASACFAGRPVKPAGAAFFDAGASACETGAPVCFMVAPFWWGEASIFENRELPRETDASDREVVTPDSDADAPTPPHGCAVQRGRRVALLSDRGARIQGGPSARHSGCLNGCSAP